MQSAELGKPLYSEDQHWISELASDIMDRKTHYPLFNGPSRTPAPRRWPFHDLQMEQSQPSPHLVGSTADMYVEHAKAVDRERPNALVTSLGVAIVGRLASFAATPMVKERSRNGQLACSLILNLTIRPIYRFYYPQAAG
jgi:hypothetical protein